MPGFARTPSSGATSASADMQRFVDDLLAVGIPVEFARIQTSKHFSDVSSGPPDRLFDGVKKKVGLLFTSRSGTTFFVDTLNRSRRVGHILEHFNEDRLEFGQEHWGVSTNEEYVASCVERFTSDNGVFGFKGTVEALLPLVMANELPLNVSDWYWITVRREDIVAQAVSLYRAKSTGYWHDRGEGDEPPPVPAYDPDRITRQVNQIQRKQGQIERFFTHFGIAPLRLVYEDFADDPLPALYAVFEHLGIDAPDNLDRLASRSKFQVLRNDQTRELVDRYRADLSSGLLP